MRTLLLLFTLFLFANLNAQYQNPNFLDGVVLFKLKNDKPFDDRYKQTDPNNYSLKINLEDYPELKEILRTYSIESIEKPSYFTRKPLLTSIFRVKLTNEVEVEQLIAKLQKHNHVEYAEREPIYTFDFVPNDTYYSGTYKWYHTLVGSEAAWDITQGNNNIKVAIVDNAVFCGHSDLVTYTQRDVADNDNIATPPLDVNADFGWSHGTHCAGLATSEVNNSLGMASLGGNVELIGVKATPNSATSSGSIWYGYAGVQWACQNGANVVSMSFGGASYSASFQSLVNSYPNIVFLAAAGNDGNTTPQYPGAYNNVICVGSVNSNDSRSSFSNYNGTTPFVDIASPGGYSNGGLISTVYTSGANNYAQMGGTSMATPFAAGLVGAMLSLNPTLTPSAIESCLLSTGVNINQSIGPRIDAPAALQCVLSTITGDPMPFFSANQNSIFESDFVTFTDMSADGGNAITNWTWSFPGGTPSSFIGQTPPPIQYTTAGSYDVSLSVTNSQSTQSLTQTAYIIVNIDPYGEWIPQASGFTQASRGINHISIVDPNIVWATAYDGSGTAANVQQFTKTTDGGLTWTPGTINVNNTGLGISMIHAFDANTAWLAAYPTAAGQTGGIWKTTNGGSTWTRQNSALFNNASSFTNVVYFWDANQGFCQGDPINGDFELYTTTNGGTTWVPVPGANIPNPTNANEFGYTRQIEVVGDVVWFTTSLGRIYRSADKGLTWSVYTTPVPDFGGAVTTSSSANFSFATAQEGLIVNNAGAVYKTTNGGANWTQLTTSGQVFLEGLCYIEGTTTAFTTGAAQGASGSSYSTDGGVTWNLIDTEQHLFVEFTNPSVGWSGWFNTDATTAGMWKWNDLSSPLDADFVASQVTACANSAVTFTDLTSGGTPTSWQWNFQGGSPASSTLANPSVTYASPGIYDVTLTVSDGSTQTTITKPAYVEVVSPAAQPGAISGGNSICEFASGTYSVVNDPNVFYLWTIPAGWTGNSSTNSIFVTADNTPGTISVSAENACGLSAPSTLAVSISVGSPTAMFTYNAAANTYTFTSTSLDATSWLWDFGDGNTSTLENPVHTYSSNGVYMVSLTVDNGCGTDEFIISVTVEGAGITEIQHVFNLHPNPAASHITIQADASFIGQEIRLKDITGKVIWKNTLISKEQKIGLTNFSKGVYFIELGTLPVKRFVKQ